MPESAGSAGSVAGASATDGKVAEAGDSATGEAGRDSGTDAHTAIQGGTAGSQSVVGGGSGGATQDSNAQYGGGTAGHAGTTGHANAAGTGFTQSFDTIAPTAHEAAEAAAWIEQNLGASATAHPFSFTYGDQPSSSLLPNWIHQYSSQDLDANRVRRTLGHHDPRTGLQVDCDIVVYRDFPVVEWTLYLTNQGASDTPIISEIQALDVDFAGSPEESISLHYAVGAQAGLDDYRPVTEALTANSTIGLTSSGGRGSDGVWPYFNLESTNQSFIAAVGWPGQWAASFTVDSVGGLHAKAGQEGSHMKLHPGETVRSPLAVLLFHDGDWIRSQNIWRRWMIAHSVPRFGGSLPGQILAGMTDPWTSVMSDATEENQLRFMDGVLNRGVPINLWWMDAGWYVNGANWPVTGTWEVDLARFPNGLRTISDQAHRRGVNTMLWFEPERVAAGTWFYENHYPWLLSGQLVDLGNGDARQWVTDMVDRIMTDERIDVYRQDFNMAPLRAWQDNDALQAAGADDRQGVTENHYIEGYLAFWDELRRRHPLMLIDSCASGGRRNDLETLRRAVPMLKSDYMSAMATGTLDIALDVLAQQTQSAGLALWVPYFGGGQYPIDTVDAYGIRSGWALMSSIHFNPQQDDLDWAQVNSLMAQRARVVPYFWGDYTPLTAWNRDVAQWLAWQFDRPDLGEGVVQAFRRPSSAIEAETYHLRGLDPSGSYLWTDLDLGDSSGTCQSGNDLMLAGLTVRIPNRPGSKVIVYRKVDGGAFGCDSKGSPSGSE